MQVADREAQGIEIERQIQDWLHGELVAREDLPGALGIATAQLGHAQVGGRMECTGVLRIGSRRRALESTVADQGGSLRGAARRADQSGQRRLAGYQSLDTANS